MNAEEIVVVVIRALTQTGVPHMTVGAIAGIYYGLGRLTNDADFVIQADNLKLTPLRSALGPDFTINPQPRIETITMGTYYIVTYKQSDFDIDLFVLRDDPHDQLAFSRRRIVPFEGGQATICTAEDYVITKLRWAKSNQRAKDAEDARAVLLVQQEKLDLPYIRHWCGQHQTLDILEAILKSFPDIPN